MRHGGEITRLARGVERQRGERVRHADVCSGRGARTRTGGNDMTNLFGEPDPPAPIDTGRGPDGKRTTRTTTVRRGYVQPPGTGPAGETCGSCCHRAMGRGGWYKCDLNQAHWTGGLGTDILLKSPACRLWEPDRKRAIRTDGSVEQEKIVRLTIKEQNECVALAKKMLER